MNAFLTTFCLVLATNLVASVCPDITIGNLEHRFDAFTKASGIKVGLEFEFLTESRIDVLQELQKRLGGEINNRLNISRKDSVRTADYFRIEESQGTKVDGDLFRIFEVSSGEFTVTVKKKGAVWFSGMPHKENFKTRDDAEKWLSRQIPTAVKLSRTKREYNITVNSNIIHYEYDFGTKTLSESEFYAARTNPIPKSYQVSIDHDQSNLEFVKLINDLNISDNRSAYLKDSLLGDILLKEETYDYEELPATELVTLPTSVSRIDQLIEIIGGLNKLEKSGKISGTNKYTPVGIHISVDISQLNGSQLSQLIVNYASIRASFWNRYQPSQIREEYMGEFPAQLIKILKTQGSNLSRSEVFELTKQFNVDPKATDLHIDLENNRAEFRIFNGDYSTAGVSEFTSALKSTTALVDLSSDF